MDEAPPPSVTSPTSLDDFRRSSIGSLPPSRRETDPPARTASFKFLSRGTSSASMGPNDNPIPAPMSAPVHSKTGSRRSFAFFGNKDRPPSSTGSITQSFLGGQPAMAKTGSGLSDASSIPEQSPASTLSQVSTAMLSQSLAPSDSPANQILYSGYLTKRGHVITNWKTRFFALRSQGRLSYYADEGMSKKLGEVQVSKVSPWSGETNGFMFQTTKQISYYVYASSNSERSRWLQALSDFYIVPDPVDCEGYLTKRGHLVPSYRMRYFVMCGTVIKYYSDETAYRTGASALAEIEVKSGGRWDGESTGLFFKTSTGSTMFVCAENVADLQKWIEALSRISAEAQKPAPVACAGWLTKQGHKRKSWKKRYFVLRGDTVSYFSDFEAANTRMGKSLSDVTVKDVALWDGETCGFMFTTVDNVPYYVFADNERDQAKWVAALKKATGGAEAVAAVTEPEKKCPRCDYVLTGTRFCGACGFNLRGTSNERSKKAPPPVMPVENDGDDENDAMDDLDALSEGARTLLLAVMQNPSIQIGGDTEGAFAPRIASNPNLTIEQEIEDALTASPPVSPRTAPAPEPPVVVATPPKPSTPEKPESEQTSPYIMRPPTPPKPSAAKTVEEEGEETPMRFRAAADSFSSKKRQFTVPPPLTSEKSFSSFGSDQSAPRRFSQPIPVDGPQPLGPSQRKTVAQLLREADSDEEEEKKELDEDDDNRSGGLAQFHLQGSAKQFDTLPPNDDHDPMPPPADVPPSPSSHHSDSLVMDGIAGLEEEKKSPKLDLHTLMERELHCTPLFVPSADAPVRCRLYASMAFATSKKILLFLGDSGPLGVWHQSDDMDAALDEDHPFAMLPYLHRAQSEGYSIVVCNPFSNSAKVFEEGGRERIVPIPSSATPKEHVFFVWEKFLQPTTAEVSVVAYQRGGSLAVALLEKFDKCRSRVHRIAFVDSKHVVNRESTSAAVLEVLGRRTIQWEASMEQALGGQIVESQERVGCVCLSIGACDDATFVLHKAEDPVFAYLLANPPRPGMTAIVKQVRAVLRARRKTLTEKKPEMRASNVFVLGEADSGEGNSENATDEDTSPEKEAQIARQQAPAPTYYLPKQPAAAPKSKTGPHVQISMRDFELIKVVGQGGFGKVFLAKKVTEPHKDESYAMKVLKKQHVLSSGLVNTTMAERKILTEISHPFVVKLYYAFQSESKLYLVMDYLSGGSLALHLRRRRKFPEEWARFYGAEVAAAIAHLHHVNIIYRDAKLENVLMDHEGHVRITDFGLSKQGVSGLQGATTFCGTAAYIAPELLKGQSYGKAADWWSFGILLYEMIGGKPPYYHRNRDIMFQTILKQEWVTFTPEFSDSAVSLIRGLLTRDPTQRLGSGPRGADEVLTHPFFDSIDWAELLAKRIPPPFNPGVGRLDTHFVAQNLNEITAQDRQASMMYRNEHGPQRHNDFDGFSFVGRSNLNLDIS
ncbi:RAC family serine/threonine-protein kinase [Achlya hypogyna]|uniref:RAC family serine/threonine-protein kinase n=1 Tax=Achlya hypogyna TaxID=1202772 RepID=A0A1V9YFN1_ACHHY|nr:RAC family serine/threonine-protein kinase [Achlya hypogyna]